MRDYRGDYLGDETILQEAQRLVHGDRGDAYGHPLDDFTTTANLWTALGIAPPFAPEDVALAMICVKLSRESRFHKRDNLTDIAGYAETGNLVHEERERREPRVVAFDEYCLDVLRREDA